MFKVSIKYHLPVVIGETIKSAVVACCIFGKITALRTACCLDNILEIFAITGDIYRQVAR